MSRLGRVLLVAMFVLATFAQLFNGTQAQAVSAAGFNPGRIIDDAIFYDPAGMRSIAEVQTFLDAHLPTCDTWGTGPSGTNGLNRAQYAQQVMGWPAPPYVCLDNYYENPNTGETSFEKGGGAFAGGQSAAQIIYDAAQQYKINPKVLLIMLRKESLNLFSDSWPMKSQYKYAMGYACPDSGPNYSAACVDSKAGFYKQVTLAAWQLRYYYNNMGSYNFAPGRVNTIQYSTNPACGTKNVYIENYATASLYIYTPYTPNDAALNAYPGTANCGAYGNRNFWFYWQEWFGSTLTNGNFVRTVDDATVYLLGDKQKYPVSDINLLGAAGGLGGVGFVSQSYLNSVPTGNLLGRIVQSPDGTIYFYDSNIKLPFTSCEMVADYGGACGSAATLTQAQIDKFTNGPVMGNKMKTTSGKSYYIKNGTKREVLDEQSLTQAGISGGYNVLNDAAFNSLSLGDPYIRDNVLIHSRQSASEQVVRVSGQVLKISSSQYTDNAVSGMEKGALDSQSIAKISATTVVGDRFKDETGKYYILTSEGVKNIPDTQSFTAVTPTQVPSAFKGLLTGTGSLSNPALVKSSSDDTVFAIVNGQKRPLLAMEDLKSITGEDNPIIARVDNGTITAIPTGNVIIGAGRLVKTPSDATVYVTDGHDKLIAMSSFTPAYDIGVKENIRTISDNVLAKYTVGNNVLTSYVVCGQTTYLGINGQLYPYVSNGISATILQSQTCNVLSKNSMLPRFISAPDGTIFELSGGVLHPITSFAKYISLQSGGGATSKASNLTISLIPKGSPL